MPTQTATPTPPDPKVVFLPLSAKQYQPFPCLRAEEEPNNVSLEANQRLPLCQGTSLLGSLPANDPNDYYRFILTTPSAVTIDLFDIAVGSDFDLYLYDVALTELAVSSNRGNQDERIVSSLLPVGTYYVRVYPDPTDPGGARTYSLRWMR